MRKLAIAAVAVLALGAVTVHQVRARTVSVQPAGLEAALYQLANSMHTADAAQLRAAANQGGNVTRALDGVWDAVYEAIDPASEGGQQVTDEEQGHVIACIGAWSAQVAALDSVVR